MCAFVLRLVKSGIELAVFYLMKNRNVIAGAITRSGDGELKLWGERKVSPGRTTAAEGRRLAAPPPPLGMRKSTD